jgi:protein TonB
MLDTLLESNAARTRRTGGTLASTLVHAALFAGAITATTRGPIAKLARPDEILLPPVVIHRAPEQAPITSRPSAPTSLAPAPVAPRLPSVDRVPDAIPPIDIDVKLLAASEDEVARGAAGPLDQRLGGAPGGLVGPTREGALDERYVDLVPRVVGNPVPPAFPLAMRERGVDGRVAIQFVVDTLGRAEMHGLRVVEASDSLFARSVRAVLPRYRFTPGEVRGQKVRTLVQLPFDFTLVR